MPPLQNKQGPMEDSLWEFSCEIDHTEGSAEANRFSQDLLRIAPGSTQPREQQLALARNSAPYARYTRQEHQPRSLRCARRLNTKGNP